MNILDLFSGIGMYALGAEQAGHNVIGFCEKDLWAKKILKKHWPMKPISSCIKSLNKALTPLLAAHRVRIIQLQIQPEQVSMESVLDSCGRCCEPFAWFDQVSGCWRTFQKVLGGGFAKFSGTWPAAGMMQNGIAYRREPQAHPTTGLESTFLPTPGAQEGKGASRNRYRNSQNSKYSRTAEALRICENDPQYLHPTFAEAIQGLPKDYTALETETHRALSEKY
jgi:C-5 cytosine-specific DNA methylase